MFIYFKKKVRKETHLKILYRARINLFGFKNKFTFIVDSYKRNLVYIMNRTGNKRTTVSLVAHLLRYNTVMFYKLNFK